MRRELLAPALITVGALLAVTACSDDPDPAAVSRADTTAPPSTTATPSTVPGGTATTVAGSSDGMGAATTDGTTGTVPAGPIGFTAPLQQFDDCPALLTYLQTEAGARVTAWGFDGGGRFYGDDVIEMAAEESADAATAGGEGAAEPAPAYSETNTQEVGVDEGDIVETDGRFVYVAGIDGLRIVSVSDAAVVAEPELPEGNHQLLLEGTRLLVVTSTWSGAADTIVSLYDVSDPASPTLLRRSHLEGGIVASRAIEGIARLVITTPLDRRLPFVQPDQFGLDEERALAENRRIIAESAVQDWLPRWFDEAGDGSFGAMQPILDCTDVAAPRDFAGLGMTWIASLDLLGEGTPSGSAGIVSTSQTVYASTDNLYVATQNWDWQWGPPVPLIEDDQQQPVEDPGPPPTLIHQFALGGGTDAAYVASGEVEGRLLNQFAMSEHNGDLRVATTIDDWTTGAGSESTVYVLRPEGGELRQLSSISGLGKGEQIYAVRFIGDVGYVVTFRQIDPLYVLDLTDPADPVLQGELKIPGYSAYLHPVGDGLLLGVGQDATEDGRPLGTQLSLFDVSDPRDPQRIDTLPIGGSSEVEWDHKAFLYWPEDGSIVLPVSPGWGECGQQVDCLAEGIEGTAGGAVVAELAGRDLDARGVITHEADQGFGCWNPLQRSIVIGDELVTVALDQLQFSDRQSLEARAAVSWGDPEQYGCYWYWEG